MSKVLLDTNVLIYSIDKESKYFQKAQQLISDINIELFTTSKNLIEFLTVITRIPGNSISLEDALTVIQDFKTITTILYPTEKSYTIFTDLLKKYKPTGLQIHDFEIISIGFASQINTIATFNSKDFEKVEEVNLYPF
ncbi:MAG: type II toxin-antitoxin system VapC family toxin [Candidatus Jettenia sp.]|nr:MAG: type II toxin-antitoxin system VapC family toxin [Candidatus Jettenia sp.]